MVHPSTRSRLVHTDYAVRTLAFAYCFITIGLHLSEHDAATGTWVLFGIQFLVYPHLVYWRALRSSNPDRAERDNLYLDSVLMGVWAATLNFPTWITLAIVGSTTMNAAVNRGAPGIAISLLCTLTGAALWAAIGGLRHAPNTSEQVTLLCFFGSMLYGTAVAKTISSGLVEAKFVSSETIICALVGAIVWNLLTWWFGLPSSSSHALIGGLVGATLASAHGDWACPRVVVQA